MQTIETKYIGATNYRGSRIVATASGSNARVTVSYDGYLSDESAHIEAAKALMGKMGWEGEMIGGHSKRGMVWVFTASLSPRFTSNIKTINPDDKASNDRWMELSKR